MRRAGAFVVLAILAGIAAACHSPSEPSPPRFIVAAIQIDSVEVVRGLSVPSGLGVRVRGFVGDGCTELLPIRQLRQGNTVFITIQAQRPEEAVCTQIAKLFDQVIPLEGEFPPGRYAVRVNASEVGFSLP